MNDQPTPPSSGPAPTSPLKVALILTPIAAIIIAGVWLAVNLGSTPPPTNAQDGSAETAETALAAAQKYMSAGSPGKAQVILEAATQKYPSDQQILAMHARSLLELGREEEALAEFERACFVGSDSAAYRDLAGTLAAQLGDDERADAHWAVAQKLEPSNPKYPLYRAQVQRRLGDHDAARANLIIATNLDPNIAEAWATLAAIALDQNRTSVARQYIDKARSLDPKSAFYRVLEARGLRRDGRAQEAADLLYAIPDAERLREKGVLAELGLCLGMLGEIEQAAKLYVRASDENSEDADIAYEAAVWLDRAGRPDDARAYATRAKSLGSTRADTLLSALEDE